MKEKLNKISKRGHRVCSPLPPALGNGSPEQICRLTLLAGIEFLPIVSFSRENLENRARTVLCKRSRAGLRMTIPGRKRDSTKNGWKRVQLGSSTKSSRHSCLDFIIVLVILPYKSNFFSLKSLLMLPLFLFLFCLCFVLFCFFCARILLKCSELQV